ncbi:TPR-like protein [Rozella allomycis CSF55]|uniref:Intraflagellar transport protein 56 n=1 Tax=Rozella allomycis (strain CSF55) TaxID=988480 RepID=A0A075AUT6_ROZAC|nr:hypothetical protein O9G_002139 [Rozella allomycis CSF55]RKP21044.1 TPR-like protein [Rozella allomycis CSF55]|eukprot:EPZ32299.1 hypothetical protein O9G_002139 [Rozella allomycis CSF55]
MIARNQNLNKFVYLLAVALFVRSLMILSRNKPKEFSKADKNNGPKIPTLEDFLSKRDYTGAMTLIDFQNQMNEEVSIESLLWYGYAAFHAGKYEKALKVYSQLQQEPTLQSAISIYIAICYFFLGMTKECKLMIEKASESRLKIRLLLHIAQKEQDEENLVKYHQLLYDVLEDQLTLASVHFLRTHYQEAIDIYKKLLVENREYLALNYYVALCYYRLEYFDVSQDVLNGYLQVYPDSAMALNLKACNFYKLYNGKAAENELEPFLEKLKGETDIFTEELIRHNLVVFRSGQGALQVLPKLLDVIPEARINLAIYYLKNDDVSSAYDLLKDTDPSTPQEYILKGIVNAMLGHEQNSKEHLKIAQQYFQLVGTSANECDTIPGRQSMAACYFLTQQFEDVMIYLNSIKTYFANDDVFLYNFAQAKTALHEYQEAEEALLLIQNEKFKNEYTYISHLSKCCNTIIILLSDIMNKKPEKAWDLYCSMETSSESYQILQLVGHECFKRKFFLISGRAFKALEALDPSIEHFQGKIASAVAAFKQVYDGLADASNIKDILELLEDSSHPQADMSLQLIRRWCKENGISHH